MLNLSPMIKNFKLAHLLLICGEKWRWKRSQSRPILNMDNVNAIIKIYPWTKWSPQLKAKVFIDRKDISLKVPIFDLDNNSLSNVFVKKIKPISNNFGFMHEDATAENKQDLLRDFFFSETTTFWETVGGLSTIIYDFRFFQIHRLVHPTSWGYVVTNAKKLKGGFTPLINVNKMSSIFRLTRLACGNFPQFFQMFSSKKLVTSPLSP